MTWRGERFVLELKIKRQESDIAQGLLQTTEYMDKSGALKGYLIAFDPNRAKSWEERIYHKKENVLEKTIEIWGMSKNSSLFKSLF